MARKRYGQVSSVGTSSTLSQAAAILNDTLDIAQLSLALMARFFARMHLGMDKDISGEILLPREEQENGPQIIAAFDEQGLFVYQAFKDVVVDAALEKGTFGRGFSLERLTWIKPGFGWILYRSRYATRRRQTRILRIKLSHEGFRTILEEAVPTTFELSTEPDRDAWSRALRLSEVRFQWDPERDLALRKTGRRALQLGIRGDLVRRYVGEWILGLEDVTGLAREIKAAIESGHDQLPEVPDERVYEVSEAIRRRLGIWEL